MNGSASSRIPSATKAIQTASGSRWSFPQSLITNSCFIQPSGAPITPLRPFGHALAQEPGRSQRQDQDQHEEGEDVLVMAAEKTAGHVADVARAQAFDDAQQHAAQNRTREVADAAQ